MSPISSDDWTDDWRSNDRVASHTPADVQAAIRRRTEGTVHYFARHPQRIAGRLRALDDEWDIERVLAVHSSSLSLFGLALGILGRRRWLLLPLVVQSFYLQHALEGWCPPLPLMRRLGIRTREEIDWERYALKAVQGDFDDVADEEGQEGSSTADRALEAAH